jgi:hypothetical protein
MDDGAASGFENLLSELKSSPEHAQRSRSNIKEESVGVAANLRTLLPFLVHTKWPFAPAFQNSVSTLERENEQKRGNLGKQSGKVENQVEAKKCDTKKAVKDSTTPIDLEPVTKTGPATPISAPDSDTITPATPLSAAPATPGGHQEETHATPISAPDSDAITPATPLSAAPATPGGNQEETRANDTEPVASSPATPLASPLPTTPTLSECASPELAIKALLAEDHNITVKDALKVTDPFTVCHSLHFVTPFSYAAETQASKAGVEEAQEG